MEFEKTRTLTKAADESVFNQLKHAREASHSAGEAAIIQR